MAELNKAITKNEFHITDNDCENTPVKNDFLVQENEDLERRNKIKLLNLIVEIIVKSTLKEYYETSD